MEKKAYALKVEYFGYNYAGWQKQKKDLGIQELVENALSKICNEKIEIICGGRTDKGVHSKGQICHFHTFNKRQHKNFLQGANGFLPKDIRIIKVFDVDLDFNARFSAKSRVYNYVIYNKEIMSPFLNNLVTHIYKKLDENLMNESCKYLIGKQDFSSFRASGCQSKSPIRNILNAKVFREKDFITFEIEGNSFLYHMVRNIMGVLIEIGKGKYKPSFLQEVLFYKDRKKSLMTAKPDGLYLMEIKY